MTKESHAVVRQFANANYSTIESAFQHVAELSQRVGETKDARPPVRKLSPFDLRVAEVAPRFLGVRYNIKAIAKHMLSTEESKLTEARMREKIVGSLDVLKRHGKIPPTSRSALKGQVNELTPFDQQVAALALQFRTHRGGQYAKSKIVDALLQREGQKVKEDERAQLVDKVHTSLAKLKTRMQIPKSEKVTKAPLRKATDEDITRFSYLVENMITSGKQGRVRVFNAAEIIGNETARLVAKNALVKAIENADTVGGKRFEAYAKTVIAGHLIDEIRKIQGRGKRRTEVAFDSAYGAARSDNRIEGRNLEAEMHAVHSLHKRGIIGRHDFAVWTLVNVFEHQKQKVAKTLGVTPSAISHIVRKVETARKED